MRSYGLGIAFGMVMAAIFAFQNTADIVVRFIVWERVLPQGVWEVTLFAAGAVAMWFISLSAILEIKGRNARLLKDQKKTIEAKDEELENVREERKSLLLALRKSGINLEKENVQSDLPGWKQDVECYTSAEEEILSVQGEDEYIEEKPEDSSIGEDQYNNPFDEADLSLNEEEDSESDIDRTGDNHRF